MIDQYKNDEYVYENRDKNSIVDLSDLSSEAMVDEVFERLQVSYKFADQPFHAAHRDLEKAKDECHRRDEPELFDFAFKKFQNL